VGGYTVMSVDKLMTGVSMNVCLHVGGMCIDGFVDGRVALMESKGVYHGFKK
jgi:hypothetical protein